MKSDYDITGWIKSDETHPFSDYLLKEPIYYNSYFTPNQVKVRSDQFKRYGTDHNVLSKIVTRVSNVESLFRKIDLQASTSLNNNEDKGDQFVRYILSN